MPDPKIVLKRMSEPPINEWLSFISNEYKIEKIRNLILIPCSFYKPYNPPHDEFYRRINDIRKKVRDSKFITVSVPLALEPEEFWDFQWRGYNLIYDCPFFPWIEKFGYKWNKKIAEEVLKKLQLVIDAFFIRNRGLYQKVIAFFTPNSPELNLIKKHADSIVPNQDPNIEVSYDNNTSEIYCHPKIWQKFESFLMDNGIF